MVCVLRVFRGRKPLKGLYKGVSLEKFTTLRIGGRADYFFQPENLKDLKTFILWVREKDIPLYILGNGSNTVFGDVHGVVLSLRGIRGLDVLQVNKNFLKVRSLAGTPLKDLIRLALRYNLKDIYRLYGFPASVGGAVAMNAGAFGVEISQFLESVRILTWEGDLIDVSARDISFSYRSSPFPDMGLVVEATFRLEISDRDTKEDFVRIKKLRQEKQPLNLPTSGSTFKNPYPFYAGKLLEEVGMKGFRLGGVAFSEKHANFLVNLGGGTFEEVKTIVAQAKKRVYEEKGIVLEEEVKIVESSGSNGWKVL